MSKYCEKLGDMMPDNLIAGVHVKQTVVSGVVAAGAGELKRGTVMARSEDGKLAVMEDGATPYGILADAVNVGDTDEVVEVYITGCFNKRVLNEVTGYELTSDDIQMLRNGGIFVENAVEI